MCFEPQSATRVWSSDPRLHDSPDAISDPAQTLRRICRWLGGRLWWASINYGGYIRPRLRQVNVWTMSASSFGIFHVLHLGVWYTWSSYYSNVRTFNLIRHWPLIASHHRNISGTTEVIRRGAVARAGKCECIHCTRSRHVLLLRLCEIICVHIVLIRNGWPLMDTIHLGISLNWPMASPVNYSISTTVQGVHA